MAPFLLDIAIKELTILIITAFITEITIISPVLIISFVMINIF